MKWYGLLVALSLFFSVACEDPTPPLSGRLRGPSAVTVYKGCAQYDDLCLEKHHLLLIANSLSDDLRIFDVEESSFFEAPNPLFPFVIQVGSFPRAIAVEPNGKYAFVVNQLSADLSIIDLAPNKLVEIDTDNDADPDTASASLKCEDHKTSERCVAGLTRLELARDAQAEDIALPAGKLRVPGDKTVDNTTGWPQETPLPVFVSLPGKKQVQRFDIQLPEESNNPEESKIPEVLSSETIDIDGIPSGLAINKNGTELFVANEDSNYILAYDVNTRARNLIDVGGPSRKVFVTPKEDRLYVFRSDESRIVLLTLVSDIDASPLNIMDITRTSAGENIETARNPLEYAEFGQAGTFVDIVLPGLPQSLTFVSGRTITVNWQGELEAGTVTNVNVPYTADYLHPKDYEGQNDVVVKDFAFVSNLDGNVYFIDAQNHKSIDVTGRIGSSATAIGYRLLEAAQNGGELEEHLLLSKIYEDNNCVPATDGCPYPLIAGFNFDKDTKKVDSGVVLQNGNATDETFSLTWEGIIPGTTSGSGRFEDNPETENLNDFKLVENRTAARLNNADVQAGDILELLTVTDPKCDEGLPRKYIIGEPDYSKQDQRVVIPIVAVAGDKEIAELTNNLATCWNEAMPYRMRARQAWVVEGSSSGQLDRIDISTMRMPSQEIVEPTYTNERFALTMLFPKDKTIQLGSTWFFSTTSGFAQARFAPTISIASSGAILSVDYVNEENKPLPDGLDDRVFLLFETSNAFLEISPATLSNRLWQ